MGGGGVQLVLLPGVAGRASAAADQIPRNREILLREALFDDVPLKIRSPPWQSYLPALQLDRVLEPVAALPAAEAPLLPGAPLAELARRDPKAAFDAVYAMLVECADLAGRDLTAEEIAAFREATKLMGDDRAAPAIVEASTDEELILNLARVMNPDGAGAAEQLRIAGATLSARAQASASMILSNTIRAHLNPMITRVLGTTLTYFNDAEARQRIREKVAHKIKKSFRQAKADNEPLVLMGHCLGGVILYDVLSSRTGCGLPRDLEVNALVTVGSQIGVIEACGLFDGRSGKTTDRLKAWLDVTDPTDVLAAKATEGIIMPSHLLFDGETGLLPSHTSYFRRPQFHARLRKRFKDLRLI
jgi:hypothetical protein